MVFNAIPNIFNIKSIISGRHVHLSMPFWRFFTKYYFHATDCFVETMENGESEAIPIALTIIDIRKETGWGIKPTDPVLTSCVQLSYLVLAKSFV